MSSIASDRSWTVDDLYTLPDDGQRYELQGGLLLAEPLPGTRHGLVLSAFVVALGEFVRDRQLGVVLTGDTGFVLARSPDTVRGPDVAFVSRERFEPVGAVPTAFPGPPDLAVEVLSPSDRPGEVHAKVADYLAAGTRLVWVIDPGLRRVSVYPPLLTPRVLGPVDTLDGGDVLPGFQARVEDLVAV